MLMKLTLSSITMMAATMLYAQEINLDIEPSRTSGIAPLYVFFDATASTGIDEGNDLANSDFTWNFDKTDVDPDGRHEITKGMVVGHVFELPGTYTVECTLTNPEGLTHTNSIQITVEEFEVTTYYVSSEGDDSNDGTSEDSPWQTASHAFLQLSANERILFRRGDTFDGVDRNLNNRTGGPMIIGAYGEGDKPIVSSSTMHILTIRNTEDLRIMDLHLIPESTGLEAVSVQESSNILVMDLEIEQTVSRTIYQDEADLMGVFDCDIHDFGVLGMFSGDSRRLSFVGNSLDNLFGAVQPEHGMRIQGGEKQFIAHNSFTRLDDTKTALTIRGDGQKHVMVYQNKFDRILGVNPQNAQTVAAIAHVTIEGNYIGHNEAHIGNEFEPSINGINIEATHIAIRNNVIDGYRNAINVSHDGNGTVSGIVDIYHNTFHWRPVTAYSGDFGRLVNVNDVFEVTVKNNLVTADDINTIEIINNDADSEDIVSEGNLLTTGDVYANTLPSSAAHLNTINNYYLSENSDPVDAATEDVPVFFDAIGSVRPMGSDKDMGAFEFSSGVIIDPLLTNALQIIIYPNPFTDYLIIKDWRNYQQIQVFNAFGQMILSIPKLENEQIDLSHLNSGTYYLQTTESFNKKKSVYRIIKE
ncbi:MAG TPA: hypothetical protein DHN29_22190 [Cytophagales bacterium]|nr:hypothetical protein [Cytophagales bacterium]